MISVLLELMVFLTVCLVAVTEVEQNQIFAIPRQEFVFARKMLKGQHVTFADQDPFIWTLQTPGDAHLAFVLGQPATVAAQIVVEPSLWT